MIRIRNLSSRPKCFARSLNQPRNPSPFLKHACGCPGRQAVSGSAAAPVPIPALTARPNTMNSRFIERFLQVGNEAGNNAAGRDQTNCF
jgi:hypothetical protein